MIRQYVRAFGEFSRNVRLFLFASSLIGFAVFGGVYPVLFNLFLLRLGYGPEFIGLTRAVTLLSYAVLSPPAGALGARWGAHRAMTAGMILAFVGFAAQPWAESIPASLREPWILGMGAVGALGMALFLTNSNPLIMASTTGANRTHAYSARSALSLLAGFLGSLIAGGLPALFAGLTATSLAEPAAYRWPLFLAALLLLPGILATGRIESVGAIQERVSKGPGSGAQLVFVLLLALADLFVLSSEGVVRTFFNVYLDSGLGAPAQQIGLLFAVAQLLGIPVALSTPQLARRWGTGRVAALCSWGMALTLIPMALVPRWDIAGLAYIGMIALAQLRLPAVGVYQMESVAPSWRARMSGIAGLALGLSWAATALGGGIVISGLGYAHALLISAGITVVGSVIFVSARRREPAKQRAT